MIYCSISPQKTEQKKISNHNGKGFASSLETFVCHKNSQILKRIAERGSWVYSSGGLQTRIDRACLTCMPWEFKTGLCEDWWWKLPLPKCSPPVELHILPITAPHLMVWRTLLSPGIEKGNSISQSWVLSKTLIMSWWNIMSLLPLNYLTKQATCKHLSTRYSSPESEVWAGD